MHNRLLNQFAFLGLSLGVLSVTFAAHAEPAAPNKAQLSATSAEVAKGPQQTTEIKMKTVSLPADVEKEHKYNRPLLLTGSTLFAVGYVPAAITALANSKQTSGWLGMPVAGPWVDWGPHTSPGNKTLLFLSGTFQALGVAAIISSFFVPESKTKKVPLMGKRRFNVSPVAGRGTYSLSATGTF